MSPPTVKKTQHQFQGVLHQLEGKLLQLQARRHTIDTRAFVVVEEVSVQPVSGPATSGLNEQQELYHGEVGSLVATATDILINALQIKLNYVNEVLEGLSLLVRENPRQATPTELSFSRYEEWLESSQQLFEFNSQLYELERAKFELKKKQERTRAKQSQTDTDTASQLVHSSISQAQALLTRLQHQSHSSQTTHAYIHELLNPRGGKTTLEAQKVQEYVDECFQFAQADQTQVRGVHRDRYQEFMAVLCSYIVEKQKNWQREDIPYELVYSAVEHCVMPRLKTQILSRVSQQESDDLISSKCHAFSDVTQDQMRVRPHLQSNEAVPFIEAITQLRASYFSSTATDKMYSVVGAAKALYDRLGDIGESSIDGDAFLDLWIYVIIKANIKDLATNLLFMIEYGNPQLACGEAGYYLTTLEAAVQFIATLSPELLQTPQGHMEFVVCERANFLSLSALPGSALEVVTEETEIQGYRMAVLREWALNRARLFRCVLVPAGYMDFAKVAVIRVNHDGTNPAMAQYLVKQLRCDGLNGLCAKSIPLGTAVVANMKDLDRSEVIVLPTGDYEAHKTDLNHVLHLERLGSLHTDTAASESCLIYPSSVTRSQDLDIPISPPYYSSTRGSMHQRGDVCPLPNSMSGVRRSNETPISSLWSSPYVLSQKLSPAVGDSAVHEVSFTNQVAEQCDPSVRSEHRRLRQTSRHLTSDSANSRITHSLSTQSDTTRSGNWRMAGLPPHSASSELSDSENYRHSTRPVTITIEAEVHEDCVPQTTDDAVDSEHGRSVVEKRDYEEENGESFRSQSEGSDRVKRKPSRDSALTVKSSGSESAPQDGGKENGYDRDTEMNQSSFEFEGSSDCEVVLTVEYRRKLEGAFIINHLYGSRPQSIADAARTLTLQAQMYLQRLNYLSVSYNITGEYDDITLNSIKTFQRAHNHHEAVFSVTLMENGHLSPTTYQYLRQAYITIYASIIRIGLDQYLGENFDPMSTAERDMRVFRECVSQLQQREGLNECQSGSMCANTIHKMKQLLHTQRQKS